MKPSFIFISSIYFSFNFLQFTSLSIDFPQIPSSPSSGSIGVLTGDPPLPVGALVEQFCTGTTMFGPYWEHVLGYWRADVEEPERVMFLRYEEMVAAPAKAVRKMAGFLGRPVGEEEVERVVRACGIETLRGQEVNRTGKTELVHGAMDNEMFFRKGVVGDWSTWLTPELACRIDDISERRFTGSGIRLG